MLPNLVICEKSIVIVIFSTKRQKFNYKKNSYLRKLLTDFRNLFFVFFLKSSTIHRNKNLRLCVKLKFSCGQATTDNLSINYLADVTYLFQLQ